MPPQGYHKCKFEVVAKGSPGLATSRSIFRNYNSFVRGCFSQPTGNQTSIYAKLLVFVISLEISLNINLFPMWFELDSQGLVAKGTSLLMNMP